LGSFECDNVEAAFFLALRRSHVGALTHPYPERVVENPVLGSGSGVEAAVSASVRLRLRCTLHIPDHLGPRFAEK
jgi:hypothetical protein